MPEIPGLTTEERHRLEVHNGLRQHDAAIEIICHYLEPERPFALRPNLLQQLQSIAVDGIQQYPGNFRNSEVGIFKSKHKPPSPHMVEIFINDMCDYVNNNFHEQTAFHLSAFIMWRLNWIHPFEDGNGRTSRILSYIILCIRLSYVLPGAPSIPQQIEENRGPYFRALEAADKVYRRTKNFDFSEMEEMLKGMLAKQLLAVIREADGRENA